MGQLAIDQRVTLFGSSAFAGGAHLLEIKMLPILMLGVAFGF